MTTLASSVATVGTTVSASQDEILAQAGNILAGYSLEVERCFGGSAYLSLKDTGLLSADLNVPGCVSYGIKAENFEHLLTECSKEIANAANERSTP